MAPHFQFSFGVNPDALKHCRAAGTLILTKRAANVVILNYLEHAPVSGATAAVSE
jgi:hypothetical protein